jgi:hypothetical protein
MSLTPMIFFRGESVCTCCDKPMYANDVGIVFVPSAKRDDIMFCTDCAVKVTMSVTQDIAKLSPDIGLSYYFKFKNPSARLTPPCKCVEEVGIVDGRSSQFNGFHAPPRRGQIMPT